VKGGVTVLVLNLDRTASQNLSFPVSGMRFTLSSPDVMSEEVLLNGKLLESQRDGTPATINGQPFKAGTGVFAPLTITFLSFPGAKNAACAK
jgi:heparanase 1